MLGNGWTYLILGRTEQSVDQYTAPQLRKLVLESLHIRTLGARVDPNSPARGCRRIWYGSCLIPVREERQGRPGPGSDRFPLPSLKDKRRSLPWSDPQVKSRRRGMAWP